MAGYAIVSAASTVINMVEWDGDTTVWTPPSGCTAVIIGDKEVGIGYTYTDGNFISNRPVGIGSIANDYWGELRAHRDKLLAECDWTQNRDVTLGNDADWKTYRQKLRDLPAVVSAASTLTAGHYLPPDNPTVAWPTKPS
tara:strand:- start:1659 stop:2078 length:420 start_codon:yes stop_codon:yes gene_type:complete